MKGGGYIMSGRKMTTYENDERIERVILTNLSVNKSPLIAERDDPLIYTPLSYRQGILFRDSYEANYINIMQEYYDLVLPQCSWYDNSYDTLIIETKRYPIKSTRCGD